MAPTSEPAGATEPGAMSSVPTTSSAPGVVSAAPVAPATSTSAAAPSSTAVPSVPSTSTSPAVKRMTGKTVVRPIVYGSIAFFLGKKSTEDSTHDWSIYVRGLEDEDLSYMIRRVVFTLHPSCQVPVVTCEKPPYVVTQSGWGEFDAKITIVLNDEEETSIDMIHFLRLYPVGSSAANVATLKKKPVVEERYEELIFYEPSESLYKTLTSHDVSTAPKNVSPEQLRACFTTISEVECMKTLVAAQKFVSQEIDRTCQELSEATALVDQLKSIKNEGKNNSAESESSAPTNP